LPVLLLFLLLSLLYKSYILVFESLILRRIKKNYVKITCKSDI